MDIYHGMLIVWAVCVSVFSVIQARMIRDQAVKRRAFPDFSQPITRLEIDDMKRQAAREFYELSGAIDDSERWSP